VRSRHLSPLRRRFTHYNTSLYTTGNSMTPENIYNNSSAPNDRGANNIVPLITLVGHKDCVISVVFSPNSTLLASGSCDSTVKIWDAKSGECLRTLEGHRDCVTSVDFSPNSILLASGSCDSTVKIWDAKSGECLRTLVGHRDCVTSVRFSPDSKRLASGSCDATNNIWDVY
jgi:WD40 repeat protein